MNEETRQKVEKYVYKNYKSLEGKALIINEHESFFTILKHKDGSPLILSKKILE
jgi:hypothetical protein